ncbi:hypothetical protein [Rhizobium tubonense]|uniref:Uncharacterized protein n=1 Tax=Rhizobium tubonense TaxID=484088 RepID=A0A2W4CNL8_9HYPH|nr:hypothetical protein [Rhizobium tubonense]PZM11995.1 hypothetical protein CPY51_17945 [Rhizobium tubonense]
MSPALSRYLKDFGAERPAPATFDPTPSFENPGGFADMYEEPAVDIEAERREAYAEGHEAATRELSLRHQAEIDERASAHSLELDALRAEYEIQAAEHIASSLGKIAVALGQAVSVETSNALAPVMTEVLTQKAVADLADLVTAAILEGVVGTITVDGPRHLFESLAAHLGENSSMLRHVEAKDVDLSVTIGDSVLVTRMSAWADSLRKILA